MSATSATQISAPSDDRAGKRLLWIAIASAMVLYLPSVWFGEVYDDRSVLITNTRLLSWSSIPYYFTHQMFALVASGKGGYYRPLFMVSLITIAKTLGVYIWAFHLACVLVFLLIVPAVFLAARELELSPTMAGWAALLFAVHPVHIEEVAWATGLGDDLAALFFILALAFYRRAQKTKQAALLAACGFYALGLLSKEAAIIFPAVAILLEIMWRDEKKKAALIRLSSIFAVAVGYLMVRAAVLGELARPRIPLSLSSALLTIPSLLLFYLRLLVMPLKVSMFYDTYYVDAWKSPDFLTPLGIGLALLVLLVIGQQRGLIVTRELFFCLAAFACLLPVLDTRMFPWRESAHDRYAYMASVFFAILVASFAERILKARMLTLCLATLACLLPVLALWLFPWHEFARIHYVYLALVLILVLAAGFVSHVNRASLAILGGFVLFLAIQCESQVWNLQDEFSAFYHASLIAPNNVNCLGRLIPLLEDRGRHAEAKQVARHVVALAPFWWSPHYDLAQMEFRDGNIPEAEKALRQAIALDPGPVQQHYLMAEILKREGKLGEAQREIAIAEGRITP